MFVCVAVSGCGGCVVGCEVVFCYISVQEGDGEFWGIGRLKDGCGLSEAGLNAFK